MADGGLFMKCRVWYIAVAAFTALDAVGSVFANEPIKEKATLKGHTELINSVAFSSNGKTLASASVDNTIRFWDVKTGEEKASVKASKCRVEVVAFSPDGKTLASEDAVGEVKLWDASTHARKQTNFLNDQWGSITPLVAFSPDCKTLALGGACIREIELCDVASGKSLAILKGYQDYGIMALAFTQDGGTLASISFNEGLKLWDVATRKKKATITISKFIRSAAFSSDGKTLATATWDRFEEVTHVVEEPACIKLWETNTGKTLSTISITGQGDVVTLAYSPDGKTLATSFSDHTIKLWDVATGKERAILNGHKDAVLCLALSPDSRTLASGGEDKTIKLWDVGPKK
jgi:WD40 repeat protein